MIWVPTLIHWLHILSAVVWAGGMIFAGVILTPAARKILPPQLRHPFYADLGRRFMLWGYSAVGVLILTGSYKLYTVWGSLPFDNLFWKVISVKIGLVAVMIVLSLLHNFVWGPRLAAHARTPESPQYQSALRQLSFWSRMNLFLVLVIVFLGAYLRMNPF